VSIDAASVPLTTPALWLTGAERGLMLAGLAMAMGGLAGRGLARQYSGPRPAPLPAPWALRGALIGLAASVALSLTAYAGPGLAANLARPPVDGLGSHATATAAVAEAVCFGLAAIALRLRRPRRSVLPLCGVVLAEGIRSHPEGIIPAAGALVTYCHLLPAVLWAGMLLYTLRAAVAWRAYPSAMRGLVGLYARAAAWLFGLVLITGVISALLLVPLGSLLTTVYGLFLVAKAVIVGVVASLAIAGQVWLRRAGMPAAGPATVTRLECAGLAIVLAVTGVLTVLTPPAKPF
jgi:copper transport protein